MKTLHVVLILFCVVELKCSKDVTSDGKAKKDQVRDDKVTVKANRRFLEEQNDEEWHVSHLKESDILEDSYCQGDTLEDKIKKYKKALLADGALIDFVSADMLPQNESELISHTCQNNVPKKKNVESSKKHSKVKPQRETNAGTSKIHSEHLKTKSDSNSENSKVTENIEILKTSQIDTATTGKMKETVTKRNKPTNGTSGDKRRASEYMFSSIEYYDEVIDFDADKCPEAVDIITLEIDQLRSYDVECEMTVEWKSLD